MQTTGTTQIRLAVLLSLFAILTLALTTGCQPPTRKG